jgi:hypothetical protein
MSSISIFSPKLGQSLGFTVDGKLDTHLDYKLGSGEFSYLAFFDADLLPKMAVFNIDEHSDIEMFIVTLPERVLPRSVEQVSYNGVHIQHENEASVWSLDGKEQKCMHRALCASCIPLLLERKIRGIGIDKLSPDLPDSDFPIHRALLSQGLNIIENLTNLDACPATGAYLGCFPLKLEEANESPARIVALYVAKK